MLQTKASKCLARGISSGGEQSSAQHLPAGPENNHGVNKGENKQVPVASTSTAAPVSKNLFKESTAKLMFRWARNQPEFQVHKESYRGQNYRGEDTIERLAFFKFFEEVSSRRK